MRSVTRPAPLSAGGRLLRVAGLGLSSYALALGAHVTGGGGGLPSWPAVLGPVTVLGMVAVVVTSAQRRFASLLAILLAEQVALHLLLSLGDAPSAMCATDVGHHGMAMAMSCSGPDGGLAMAVPGLPMLAAHLAATLITAWLLARGETWLWRVLARALWFPAAVCAPPRRESAAVAPHPSRPARRCRRPAVPRGTPGPALVLAV